MKIFFLFSGNLKEFKIIKYWEKVQANYRDLCLRLSHYKLLRHLGLPCQNSYICKLVFPIPNQNSNCAVCCRIFFCSKFQKTLIFRNILCSAFEHVFEPCVLFELGGIIHWIAMWMLNLVLQVSEFLRLDSTFITDSRRGIYIDFQIHR